MENSLGRKASGNVWTRHRGLALRRMDLADGGIEAIKNANRLMMMSPMGCGGPIEGVHGRVAGHLEPA